MFGRSRESRRREAAGRAGISPKQCPRKGAVKKVDVPVIGDSDERRCQAGALRRREERRLGSRLEEFVSLRRPRGADPLRIRKRCN
jgi:hypothetical protein